MRRGAGFHCKHRRQQWLVNQGTHVGTLSLAPAQSEKIYR